MMPNEYGQAPWMGYRTDQSFMGQLSELLSPWRSPPSADSIHAATQAGDRPAQWGRGPGLYPTPGSPGPGFRSQGDLAELFQSLYNPKPQSPQQPQAFWSTDTGKQQLEQERQQRQQDWFTKNKGWMQKMGNLPMTSENAAWAQSRTGEGQSLGRISGPGIGQAPGPSGGPAGYNPWQHLVNARQGK